MKKTPFWIIAPFALTAITVGCKPNDRSASEQETAVTQQINKVQADTSKAMDNLDDYTYAQKEALIKNLEVQIAAIDKSIDELSTKIEESSSAVQTEAQPWIANLRAQSKVLHKQLDGLKGASESTWESVKKATSNAYSDVKTGLVNTREWLSEKIAP